MDHPNYSRLVYAIAAGCVALSQVYFMTRNNRADKIHLLERTAIGGAVKRRQDQEKRASEDDDGGAELQVVETLIQNKSNLPNLDKPLRFWYAMSLARNALLLLKYLVLCLLDHKSLAHLRYLDCFLLGRVTFNGRIVGMVKYAVFCLTFFQVAWRVIMLIIRPNFRFDAMEFLLKEPGELILWEAQSGHRQRRRRTRAGVSESKYSALLDYKNPFISKHEHHFVRIRPNRTCRAWRQLSLALLAYLTLVAGSLVLMSCLLAPMSLVMQITKAGFKLEYHHCIEWVREQPNKLDYEFIYAGIANDTSPLPVGQAFMPFSEFIELNAYQTLRLANDLFDNVIFFMESVFSIYANTALAIVVAADTRQYCRSINARVKQLIARLQEAAAAASQSTRQTRCFFDRARRSSGAQLHCQALESAEWGLKSQLLDTQAVIVDFLAQVRRYNAFAAFFTLFNITIWFTYSAFSASWLFIPQGLAGAGRLEWYAIQAIASVFIFILVGNFNAVRHESARLYLSLCTLATLDGTRAQLGEARWLGLMRHYAPVPLACFTTSRQSPISWLLGVQIFSWLASALFVASGFFVRPQLL